MLNTILLLALALIAFLLVGILWLLVKQVSALERYQQTMEDSVDRIQSAANELRLAARRPGSGSPETSIPFPPASNPMMPYPAPGVLPFEKHSPFALETNYHPHRQVLIDPATMGMIPNVPGSPMPPGLPTHPQAMASGFAFPQLNIPRPAASVPIPPTPPARTEPTPTASSFGNCEHCGTPLQDDIHYCVRCGKTYSSLMLASLKTNKPSTPPAPAPSMSVPFPASIPASTTAFRNPDPASAASHSALELLALSDAPELPQIAPAHPQITDNIALEFDLFADAKTTKIQRPGTPVAEEPPAAPAAPAPISPPSEASKNQAEATQATSAPTEAPSPPESPDDPTEENAKKPSEPATKAPAAKAPTAAISAANGPLLPQTASSFPLELPPDLSTKHTFRYDLLVELDSMLDSTPEDLTKKEPASKEASSPPTPTPETAKPTSTAKLPATPPMVPPGKLPGLAQTSLLPQMSAVPEEPASGQESTVKTDYPTRAKTDDLVAVPPAVENFASTAGDATTSESSDQIAQGPSHQSISALAQVFPPDIDLLFSVTSSYPPAIKAYRPRTRSSSYPAKHPDGKAPQTPPKEKADRESHQLPVEIFDETLIRAKELFDYKEDRESALQFVLGLALNHIEASDGAILLAESTNTEAIGDKTAATTPPRMRFEAAFGTQFDPLLQTSIPHDQGMVGYCLREKAGLLIDDATQEASFQQGAMHDAGLSAGAFLCAPIQRDEQDLGVIVLHNPVGSEPFALGELHILIYLAHMMGDYLTAPKDSEPPSK